MQNSPASTLPSEGFVRIDTILKIFPIGKSSWWAGIRAGRYPQPVKIGAKSVAWRVEDIRNLLAKPPQKPIPCIHPKTRPAVTVGVV